MYPNRGLAGSMKSLKSHQENKVTITAIEPQLLVKRKMLCLHFYQCTEQVQLYPNSLKKNDDSLSHGTVNDSTKH